MKRHGHASLCRASVVGDLDSTRQRMSATALWGKPTQCKDFQAHPEPPTGFWVLRPPVFGSVPSRFSHWLRPRRALAHRTTPETNPCVRWAILLQKVFSLLLSGKQIQQRRCPRFQGSSHLWNRGLGDDLSVILSLGLVCSRYEKTRGLERWESTGGDERPGKSAGASASRGRGESALCVLCAPRTAQTSATLAPTSSSERSSSKKHLSSCRSEPFSSFSRWPLTGLPSLHDNLRACNCHDYQKAQGVRRIVD